MGDPRILLADRLRLQSSEISQAILDRLRAIEGEDPVRDIEYLQGLEAAVTSGVDFGLELITLGDTRTPPFPLPVLTQARLAARHRIPLETVIRRYFAAKTMLHDFVLASASELPTVGPPVLHKTLAAHNALFDQLIASVFDEYEREATDRRAATWEPRQLDLIKRLLRGDHADASSLSYPFEGHHLGLMVVSPDPQPRLRLLSKELDFRLLTTRPTESATWAWLGAREPPDAAEVSRWAHDNWPPSVPLGIGEAGRSLSGWRQTHHQARAAAALFQIDSPGGTRYRDIALLSAACRDPLLLASLREMYLDPLAQERGEVLRATLRAFFDADRNSSSAASALGVSRQTVSKRLQLAEERISQPVATCGDLLKAALQLEKCGAFSQTDNR